MNNIKEKIQVTYFFRKPQLQYFSIEKVFEQVINHLPDSIEPVIYKLKNGTNGWWGRLKALAETWQNKGVINHITGDITFVAMALPKKGLIVTYHDLESLTQYKGWKLKVLKYFWVSIPVKRAQVVTAISNHTKEQLIKWTNCNADKIVVVPNPLPEELEYSPKEFNKIFPTVLVMGTKANKNVEGIFEAVASVSGQWGMVNGEEQGTGNREQGTEGSGEGNQSVVGSEEFSKGRRSQAESLKEQSLGRRPKVEDGRKTDAAQPLSELQRGFASENAQGELDERGQYEGKGQQLGKRNIPTEKGERKLESEEESHKLPATSYQLPVIKLIVVGKMTEAQKALAEQYNLEVENLVHVPYADILTAYKRCDLLCFPSYYEGFGLPIIEAQATGRPVITSNFGAMQEVAGEGGLLVDPYSIEDIQNAIRELLEDNELRNQMVKKGLRNVERFKADVVAGKYGEVYKT